MERHRTGHVPTVDLRNSVRESERRALIKPRRAAFLCETLPRVHGLTFVPERLSFLEKQQLITEKSVFFLRGTAGRAGGNCELIAISFILLCICQRRRGPHRTDGDVTQLLFRLRSHMVSIPLDTEGLCMPDMI